MLLFGNRRDPVTIVGAIFVLFVAVPTRYSFIGFGPLTPGMLVASLALLWWIWARVSQRGLIDKGGQPIHAVVVMLLIGASIGFATMFTHPVTSEQFVNAHRSPGILLMFVGITLLVADAVPNRRRLDDLLEILVLCAGTLAVCGLIEQVTGERMFTGKVLPLLTENPSQLTISERNGFLRVAGTAKHPIEFAVVLATMLPIGIHLALHGRDGFRRTARWLTVLMAMAIPLAISRSGIIGAAVGVLVLSLGWSWHRRAVVATGAVAAVTVLALAIPQLVGTVQDLFLHVGDDTSIAARTRDYRVLDDVLADSPWFGRGLGEYNVVDYEVFDNQYLATIVDGGYLGLGVQLAAFVAPVLIAWKVSRSRSDPSTRHLAQAVAASLCVLMVSWAFFDGAGYRIATALVYALTGVAGALWRLEHRDRDGALDLVAHAVRQPVHAWGAPPTGGRREPVGHWGKIPLPAAPPVRREPRLPVPVSVVVPAHDEERVIDRFLATLLADALPGELDVTVVCNGCGDRTAEIARQYPVRVVELDEPSKHKALRRGDELAMHFPRFYVDADVQLTTRSLRATAAVLASGQALAAAPRLDLDLRGCGTSVRAYYRVWRRLPYCTGDLVGSGVYGVSGVGHERLGAFPELIADDLWFRNHFEPGERVSVRSARFVQHPPHDLRSLLRVRTRQHLGNIEYRRRFGEVSDADGNGGRWPYLRGLLAPAAVVGTPVYLGVNAVARQRARRRWRDGALHWDADVSARMGSA